MCKEKFKLFDNFKSKLYFTFQIKDIYYNMKKLKIILPLCMLASCSSPLVQTYHFEYKTINIDSNNNVYIDLYIGLKPKQRATTSFSELDNPKLTIYINYPNLATNEYIIKEEDIKLSEDSIVLFETTNFINNDYTYSLNNDKIIYDKKESTTINSIYFPDKYTFLFLIMDADQDSTSSLGSNILSYKINYKYIDNKLIIE